MSGMAARELARTVRSHREAQRWSYRDLEAKLREYGQPILASGLLKLERAERRTDVDELTALAAVLGIPVVELLGIPTAAGPDQALAALTARVQQLEEWRSQQPDNVPRQAARRHVTSETLREVARVYRREIGSNPTEAVAEHLGVAMRTARLYVRRARDAGFLGKALSGKAGEVSADTP